MLEWADQGRTEDLFRLALGWLREDRELRRVKERESGHVRGPKEDVRNAPFDQIFLADHLS